MTKLLFAAAIVAALAAVATSAPLSASDPTPTPVTCFECTVLGNLVEVLLKQGKTKDQIDQEVQAVCTRLPAPLQKQCLSAVTTQLDPLITALQTSNNDVKAACKSIGKCAAANLSASPIPCLLCEVEASLLKKMLQTNTAEEIDTQLQAVCAKLPSPLQAKCLQAITTVIDPILGAFKAKPDDTPQHACIVASQCPATEDDEDMVQLVEATMVAEEPKASPLDCIVCSVEAALLSKALQNNTKAQIDTKITAICDKLPAQLKPKCQDCLNTKINPLIDELVANVGESPKVACQKMQRCQASDALEELVEKVTATGNNKLDCVVCGVEAALLSKALQNNTKAQIDTKLQALCGKLPQPLQPKCQAAVTNKINPLIDELVTNNGESPKLACQKLQRCPASDVLEELVEKITAADLGDNQLDCLVCGVEATLLSKALNNNTKAQIDTKLQALCGKLPQPLQPKCQAAITNKINPLIDELVTNAGESPKAACQKLQRCPASNVLEELVEKITAVDRPCHTRNCFGGNQLDCLLCGIEAALLEKALQSQTKQQIDANLTTLCHKIPQQLQQKCLDAVNNKINPLIDELVTNTGEAPKVACQHVSRCSASIDEEEFLDIATALVAPTVNPAVDCAVCGLEASLLAKALNGKKTKAQIDAKLAMVCSKLPAKLVTKCNNAVTNKIDPLIDALVASQNDPKVACKVVKRCQM